LGWLLSKKYVTAPIIGVTKAEHLTTAVKALDFSLTENEINSLEAPYVPHPVNGIIPPLSKEPMTITPPRV